MAKLTVTTTFNLGQIVYLRASPEMAGMVTGFILRGGAHLVLVAWGDHEETAHWEMELTEEKGL